MKHQQLLPSLPRLLIQAWQAIYAWFKANTFTPRWMPRRWRHPLVGYALAILITLAAIAVDLLLVTLMPAFDFYDLLVTLAILWIALTWGAGPGLVATLLGALLLYYVIIPPQFALLWKDFVNLLQNGFVLFGGFIITLIASQRERHRRAAEERARAERAARQEAEALSAALAEAQARNEQEHQHLRRIVDALIAMAEALVQPPEETAPPTAEGFPPADVAARKLAELTCQILDCHSLSLSALEPETGALTLLAVAGGFPKQECQWQHQRHQELHRRVWSDPAFAARLQAGEMIRLDLAQPPFNDQPTLDGGRILLVVPLCIRPRLVGLLVIEHDKPADTLTAEHLGLAAAVAQLGALVIERERLARARAEAQANVLALREANRQMETFMSVASHELKTPLTSIILGLQMSQRSTGRLVRQVAHQAGDVNALAESLQTIVATTLHQGGRLTGLVNDLLDTSRIQAGRLALQLQPADLIAIVRAAVEEQRSLAPERTIYLYLPQSRSVAVTADAARIGQVVTNFLTNALRYSTEDRPVVAGVQVEQAQARLWVRDQGPGLPAAEQAHIWERFYRVPGVEVQSGSGVGMGIGLFISKTIVEQHHGQVGVQSVPGEGATFWFTLPLA